LKVEAEDISPADAADVLGAEGFEFTEGPVAGEFKI